MKTRTTCLTLTLGAVLVLAAACSGDPEGTTPTVSNCAPTDPSCPALSVASDCLALVDNSGKDKFALRVSQLTVKKPTVLAQPFVAKLVGDGVFINLPQCNVAGTGTFSLITEFDKANGKLRTGGARPEADPSKGYCFANDTTLGIAPVESNASYNADGSFTMDPIDLITVPIYLDIEASSVVLLPLRNALLTDGKISADNNCIGKFNAEGLEPINQCKPDPDEGINYFVNGGNLTGHITLEDADGVVIDLLSPKQTLCVLLSGDSEKFGEADKDEILRCKRDANMKIELEGDWCSADDAPGGCKDSFQLESSFAASSVTLRTDCK